MPRYVRYKPMLPGHKVCSRCAQEKPWDQFKLLKITKDGHHSWCKSCDRLNARARQSLRNFQPLVDGHKVCTKCKQDKPYIDFAPSRTMKDGRHSWCRPCLYAAVEKCRRRLSALVKASLEQPARSDTAPRT